MAANAAVLVRMNRWVILGGYALLTACTQLLWLAYAPITTQAHRAMGVSTGTVGDLAIIFPLMYVILALPAGRWLDTRFGQALGLGAILTAGGGLLRLAGPSSYGWALAGQFVIAAGQPFVLNAITKVAARYFPARERTAAISVGSVALFVGILAAVLSGGPLFDAGGLTLLLWVQASVAVLAAVWVPVTAGLFLAGCPLGVLHTLLTLVVDPLWFLGVYAALTALTPVAIWLARRFGAWAAAFPAAIVAAVDLVRFGNPKALDQICKMVVELGAHRRVILGTDSPTGNGVEPLGMLHLITHLASLTEIKAEEALCMATGNTARVYDLPTGIIEAGSSADVALIDAPVGSIAKDALESFTIGDSPAVGMVMIDGLLVVKRSKNTIPPQRNYKLTTH